MGSGIEQQVYDDGTEGEEARARRDAVLALADLALAISTIRNELKQLTSRVFQIARAVRDTSVVPAVESEVVP